MMEQLGTLGALEADDRMKCALACHFIAIGHFGGIVTLFRAENPGAAYAVARACLESFTRGAWLFHCASEDDVERFIQEDRSAIPRMEVIIDALGEVPDFRGGVLKRVFEANWALLNSFTHTGFQQVIRHFRAGNLELNYDDDESQQILQMATAVAQLSFMQMALLGRRVDLAEQMLGRVQAAQAD
jgi:hypothetical protein